jgi:hypothetical protein
MVALEQLRTESPALTRGARQSPSLSDDKLHSTRLPAGLPHSIPVKWASRNVKLQLPLRLRGHLVFWTVFSGIADTRGYSTFLGGPGAGVRHHTHFCAPKFLTLKIQQKPCQLIKLEHRFCAPKFLYL